MQAFRDILATLPPAEQVLADAYAAYPGRPELANLSARVVLEGLYLSARYALEALVDRVEREDRIRDTPTVELSPDDLVLTLDPDAVFPVAANLPNPATDVTRRELVGAERDNP